MPGRRTLQMALVMLLMAASAAGQDHELAFTAFTGSATFTNMASGGANDVRMAPGALGGVQAELWLGRFGGRLNVGAAERGLVDDPGTSFRLTTGDLDLMVRLLEPQPRRFFSPYVAAGLGLAQYDLAIDAALVGGEAYSGDPRLLPTGMVGIGADLGGGVVGARFELYDIISLSSPLERPDGSRYGPVQHIVLTLGLSVRLGGTAGAQPGWLPWPTTTPTGPAQPPGQEEEEEEEEPTEPEPPAPQPPETPGPLPPEPETPGPLVPEDTTRAPPPERPPTPQPRPPVLPPDTTPPPERPPVPQPRPPAPPDTAPPPMRPDSTPVPGRPGVPRPVRADTTLPPQPPTLPPGPPLPGPPPVQPGDTTTPPIDTTLPPPEPPPTPRPIRPPQIPRPPVQPPPTPGPIPAPRDTATTPPTDTTTAPPTDTTTTPPTDTTTAPPPDTTGGEVHGRLFTVRLAPFGENSPEAARAGALADTLRAHGVPVWPYTERVRGQLVSGLRVGALRNAADANTLGDYAETDFDLDWEWVHIDRDQEVPASDVAASEAFVEMLKGRSPPGRSGGQGPPG